MLSRRRSASASPGDATSTTSHPSSNAATTVGKRFPGRGTRTRRSSATPSSSAATSPRSSSPMAAHHASPSSPRRRDRTRPTSSRAHRPPRRRGCFPAGDRAFREARRIPVRPARARPGPGQAGGPAPQPPREPPAGPVDLHPADEEQVLGARGREAPRSSPNDSEHTFDRQARGDVCTDKTVQAECCFPKGN